MTGRPEAQQDRCPVHDRPWREERGMANGIVALHCPWDGSLHPDRFMELIERPGTTLTPTDKNYKVYVAIESHEGADELRIVAMTRREGRPDDRQAWRRVDDEVRSIAARDGGWGELEDDTWVILGERGTRREDKFYFEHLSDEQRARFCELLNAGKLNLAYPGHFYVLPFFLTRPAAAS